MRKKFDFGKIKENMQKKEAAGKKDYTDKRFWKLGVNNNKGSAIIRFLPDPESGNPWKKHSEHAFDFDQNGNQKWYIENCSKDLGDPCPVCERSWALRKSAHQVDKDRGYAMRQKFKYVSNILVLKDPANPSNEGKVFLFSYGPMIQKMLAVAMGMPVNNYGQDDSTDDLDDEQNIFYPHDVDGGADFLYKATPGTGGFKYTYTMSKFKSPSELFGELDEDEREEKLDAIMAECHDTENFPAESTYPTQSQSREKLGAELGIQQVDDDNDFEEVKGSLPSDPVPDKKPAKKAKKESEPDDDADDVNSFIDSL